MAGTGLGTGGGPLDHQESGGSAVVGIMRPVGATFSTGIQLRHSGWFDVRIESIRPLARPGAESGMPLRELSLSRNPGAHVGIVDGAAEEYVPRAARRPVANFVIRSGDSDGSTPTRYVAAVATWDIAAEGYWAYDGYEIVYRHGLVRHRLTMRLGTEGCTLGDEVCNPSS